MSSFDSDNDFLQEDYYETNGNFYSANGVYQGLYFHREKKKKCWKMVENYLRNQTATFSIASTYVLM